MNRDVKANRSVSNAKKFRSDSRCNGKAQNGFKKNRFTDDVRICLASVWRTEEGGGRTRKETSSVMQLGEMDMPEKILGNICCLF